MDSRVARRSSRIDRQPGRAGRLDARRVARPGTNRITVVVSDNGVPSLSATQTFNVTVREVNRAPVFEPVPSRLPTCTRPWW